MTHGPTWRPAPRHALLLLLLVIVGTLHREAAAPPWTDDRSLAAEPAWLQMGAPRWHAAAGDSASLPALLTRAIDPLTRASAAGDMRALAAILAGLAAVALLAALRRAGVPPIVALLLTAATTGTLLPVGPPLAVAHALQILLAAALLLAWRAPQSPSFRLASMAAVTVVGALNHASFLAFAAVIWSAAAIDGRDVPRLRVAITGAISLACALVLTSWLLWLDSAAPAAVAMDRPGLAAMLVGLVSGRFAPALQPVFHSDLRTTTTLCLPGPAIVCAPLAVLALLDRARRPMAIAVLAAAAAVIAFTAGTWLPDPSVGAAAAWVALLVLAGLGLTWVAAQPIRGAAGLAIATAALLGAMGWLSSPSSRLSQDAADLQTLAEAAPEIAGGAPWSVEHLTVARALARDDEAFEDARQPLTAAALETPDDRARLLIGSPAAAAAAAAWSAPAEVRYPSAARFLATLPERLWLAAALHDRPAAGFCADLIRQLTGDAAAPGRAPIAALVRLGDRGAGAAGDGRLDLPYGAIAGRTREPVPAHFDIAAGEAPHVVINDDLWVAADRGLLLAAFDPWTSSVRTWTVGSCDSPIAPALDDRRLAPRFFLGPPQTGPAPAVPAVSAVPVRVDLGLGGAPWLGAGWHGPEGAGLPFRWTAGHDAEVHVVAARRGALRVRLTGRLAGPSGDGSGLGVTWNGTAIRPMGPWLDGPSGAWIVPADLVRRGANVLGLQAGRLVSPAAGGASGDTRELGLEVRELVIEPVDAAPR